MEFCINSVGAYHQHGFGISDNTTHDFAQINTANQYDRHIRGAMV
jgi:hypothetical protein